MWNFIPWQISPLWHSPEQSRASLVSGVLARSLALNIPLQTRFKCVGLSWHQSHLCQIRCYAVRPLGSVPYFLTESINHIGHAKGQRGSIFASLRHYSPPRIRRGSLQPVRFTPGMESVRRNVSFPRAPVSKESTELATAGG